jgi:hypothetical protein
MFLKQKRIPNCHPENKHYAIGLCKKCYDKNFDDINKKPFRKNGPKSVGRRVSDCHPGRQSFSKGKCKNCYAKELRRLAKEKDYNLFIQKNREYSRKWNKDNKNKNQGYYYYRQYGITFDEYTKLCTNQNNKCAICNKPCKVWNKLSVDHNHITGEIRGLLCLRCNVKLGVLEDLEWKRKAENYLKNHPLHIVGKKGTRSELSRGNNYIKNFHVKPDTLVGILK